MLMDDDAEEVIPRSLCVKKMLELVEKEIIARDEKINTMWCEMTAYSDALWLASMWPCPKQDHEDECVPACHRMFLHDGFHWYRYQVGTGQWQQSDRLMHRIVAEGCVLPFRQLRSYFSSLYDRCQHLIELGHDESTRLEDEDSMTLKTALKTNHAHVQALNRHIKRLHSWSYQKEVLTIAAQLFFALPPWLSKKKRWKNLSSSILPVDQAEGRLLSLLHSKVVYRKATPEDCIIKAYTPRIPLPSQDQMISVQWFDAFKKHDLPIIQQWLRSTLLYQDNDKVCKKLILWGITPLFTDDLIHFLEALLGKAFLSDDSTFQRLKIIQISPTSERELLSMKEKILSTLKKKEEQSTLIMVNSIHHKICSPFIHPSSKLITLIQSKASSLISSNELFWSSSSSSSSSSTTRLTLCKKKDINHLSHFNALTWLFQDQ